MEIDINELARNSFVLSVNRKRLDFFYGRWEASGLPPRPRRVACIQLRKNNFASMVIKKTIDKDLISVMSTHLMVVSMAQAMELPFACVFEDDAVGCIDVKDRLQELLLDVPDNADVVVLGNTKTFGVREDLGKWIVPTRTFGLQAYICMQKNYDRFLNSLAGDYRTGLTACGENVYLAKDIVFCQYSLDGSMNLQWHKDERGFFHQSLSKEYIDGHFSIVKKEE